MTTVTDLLEVRRRKRLAEIEQGLIPNINDALIHSFQHLDRFKITKEVAQLKWAVISAVQAAELLANVLLISTSYPLERLFLKSHGKELEFRPPSFNQSENVGLLDLIQKYRVPSNSPQNIPDEELELLKSSESLALIRNELMHRTMIALTDHGVYAKSALSTLLIFEHRFHPVDFPLSEEFIRVDAEVSFLLSWLKGEAREYFSKAANYLKSVGVSGANPNCPICGSCYGGTSVCRVCRTTICAVECSECGHYWFEENRATVPEKCESCGSSHSQFFIQCDD